MAELTVRLDLSFGSRSLRCLIATAMVFSAVTEVASESVTLTTYYPAPSGVYSQMITTGNTYLARDGGYLDVGTSAVLPGGTEMAIMGGSVGIGTTAPGYTLDVAGNFHVSGPAWAGLIQSGTASAYFAHSGGYGAYIDAGTSANAGTYALDINKAGTPFLYVSGSGMVGIDTAGPAHQLDVAGAEGNYGMLPHYSGWAGYGTGDGGAAIYNDAGAYLTLMVVGNNSAGGPTRHVSVWDELTINGQVVPTDANCQEENYLIDGFTTCAGAGYPGASYATATSGVIADLTLMPLYVGGVGGIQDGLAPMLCCTCPASGCPNLP